MLWVAVRSAQRGALREINVDTLVSTLSLGYVGDEFHFLFKCPELHDLRTGLLPRFCHNNPNMLKLESLMTCVNTFMLNKLAKFISQ